MTDTAALLQSETDEQLMKSTLLRCYGSKVHGFRVSAEHYRYLAEQVVALRAHIKRSASTARAKALEEAEAIASKAADEATNGSEHRSALKIADLIRALAEKGSA